MTQGCGNEDDTHKPHTDVNKIRHKCKTHTVLLRFPFQEK